MVQSGKYGSMTANNGLGTGGRSAQHQELADAVNADWEPSKGKVTAEQVKNKLKSLRRTCQRALA